MVLRVRPTDIHHVIVDRDGNVLVQGEPNQSLATVFNERCAAAGAKPKLGSFYRSSSYYSNQKHVVFVCKETGERLEDLKRK